MHYHLQILNEARNEYLNQCAYMHQAMNTYAEQRGGVEALTDADARNYNGRQAGLIKLVAYDDAVMNCISEMQDWIEQLLNEKRSLKAEVDRIKGISHMSKEEQRSYSICRAMSVWADHY